jgi:hypothetical protein
VSGGRASRPDRRGRPRPTAAGIPGCLSRQAGRRRGRHLDRARLRGASAGRAGTRDPSHSSLITHGSHGMPRAIRDLMMPGWRRMGSGGSRGLQNRCVGAEASMGWFDSDTPPPSAARPVPPPARCPHPPGAPARPVIGKSKPVNGDGSARWPLAGGDDGFQPHPPSPPSSIPALSTTFSTTSPVHYNARFPQHPPGGGEDASAPPPRRRRAEGAHLPPLTSRLSPLTSRRAEPRTHEPMNS